MESKNQEFASIQEAVETWLSTPDSDEAFSAALAEVLSREGGGSNGRNLNIDYLVRLLPPGLSDLLPAPDKDFVTKALSQILPDSIKGGFSDSEDFGAGLQTVLLQLASAADMLQALAASDPTIRTLMEDYHRTT